MSQLKESKKKSPGNHGEQIAVKEEIKCQKENRHFLNRKGTKVELN